ncbi:MAG: MBL fold metallo-hydrolase [Desulfobacteraceae bacterium]|nr:MBL fold metallo-hydrolase [Desulfobacteraceae bacterium]
MEIEFIRNATMKIEYNGELFLTDPMLSDKFEIESFAGNSRNPTIGLPCSIYEILQGVDTVISSHIHQDHFDATAMDIIPSEMSIFCQPEDTKNFLDNGFVYTESIDEKVTLNWTTIIRTTGHHGTGEMEKTMGKVSGYVLQADNEPVVYWAGDTIYCDEVKQVITEYKPDYIITHSCGATLDDSGPIIMDAEQTVDVCKNANDSVVIAIHMEALDHATISRKDLRELADKKGISKEKLLIPNDGEIITFNVL